VVPGLTVIFTIGEISEISGNFWKFPPSVKFPESLQPYSCKLQLATGNDAHFVLLETALPSGELRLTAINRN